MFLLQVVYSPAAEINTCTAWGIFFTGKWSPDPRYRKKKNWLFSFAVEIVHPKKQNKTTQTKVNKQKLWLLKVLHTNKRPWNFQHNLCTHQSKIQVLEVHSEYWNILRIWGNMQCRVKENFHIPLACMAMISSIWIMSTYKAFFRLNYPGDCFILPAYFSCIKIS